MTEQMNEQAAEETLIEFPAKFPIKITGKNTPEFQAEVISIMNRLIPEQDRLGFKEQASKNGNYLAISITAMFYDKAAIDAVYQALSNSPHVIMAL